MDVALAANVSQATVSRAFAGGKVSVDARERVFAAARHLNYHPNAVARSLTMGRSRLIGLIVSDQTSLIYPELVYELTERLAMDRYRVMLFTTSESRSTESVLAEVRSHRVDGVISLALLTPDQCSELARADVSVVLYNQVSGSAVSSVYCDHADVGQRVARALDAAAFRKVGVLAGPEDSFVSGSFLKALERGLERSKASLSIVHAAYRYDAGRAGAKALLDEIGGALDCIVSVNDTVAAGCIDYLRYVAGVAVPDDVAVFALNGRGPSLWGAYTISAMRQPTERMADAAVQAVLARIDDPGRPAEHRVFFSDYFAGATGRLPL